MFKVLHPSETALDCYSRITSKEFEVQLNLKSLNFKRGEFVEISCLQQGWTVQAVSNKLEHSFCDVFGSLAFVLKIGTREGVECSSSSVRHRVVNACSLLHSVAILEEQKFLLGKNDCVLIVMDSCDPLVAADTVCDPFYLHLFTN